MIASITGNLLAKGADHAIVGVGGLGIKVFIPAPALAGLGQIGDLVQLYTLLYVRQEQLALYGFANEQQLRVFELLLGVSGIGPKAALAVLSAPIDLLQSAVAMGKPELLGRLPGVGQKTIARVLVELKGKLPAASPVVGSSRRPHDADVVSALTGLGYSQSDAVWAVESLAEDDQSLEARIIESLRQLASR